MKIIILATGALGDTLMLTPTIKVLRKNFPSAQIDALTAFQTSYYVLKNNPYLNKIYYYPFLKKGYLKSINYLLSNFYRKYNVSLTFYPSYRKHYHIIAFLVNAKKRIAVKFHKGYISECFFLYTDLVKAEEDKHHVINNLKLLKPLGIEITEKEAQKFDLEFYPDPISDKAQKILNSLKTPYIFLHNGSSTFKKGSDKRRLNFSQLETLINKLIFKGYQIVFNVGPEERIQGKYLQEKMGSLIVNEQLVLLSDMSLSDLSYIIKKSYKVISTDSGIHHLASALKKEIILILGPTDERKIYPWNTKYHSITAPVKCRPCYLSYTQKAFECKNGNKWECMKKIDVGEIVSLV